ncbi:MAG: chemotaxis protein CheW [Oscillospiraceae bacterium]
MSAVIQERPEELSENELEQPDTSEMDGKYLTFWTDGQLFGVPIAHVVQIVGMQKVTEVPEFPYFAKGIINLRGAIIPVLDIRLRLGKQEAEYNERTCIIVTEISSSSVGFIVDEVDAVMAIDDNLISPPPKVSGGSDGYIVGVGKLESRVVLLMDTRKIVGAEEFEMLTAEIA